MEIIKAIGDMAFVVGLTAIMLTPRILEMVLTLRRK